VLTSETTSASWQFSSLHSFLATNAPLCMSQRILRISAATYFMSATTPFQMPTIALASSTDTGLHFNYVTPCSETLLASCLKTLAEGVSILPGRQIR